MFEYCQILQKSFTVGKVIKSIKEITICQQLPFLYTKVNTKCKVMSASLHLCLFVGYLCFPVPTENYILKLNPSEYQHLQTVTLSVMGTSQDKYSNLHVFDYQKALQSNCIVQDIHATRNTVLQRAEKHLMVAHMLHRPQQYKIY